MRLNLKTFLQMSVLALLWCSASAFINPNFTPVDLVKQSDIIVQLDNITVAKEKDDKGCLWVTATVKKVLKGKLEQKELKVDLLAGIAKEDGESVQKRIQNGATQAVMFVGMFAQGEEEGGAPAKEARGFLHLGGQWVITIGNNKDTTWDMDKTDDHMLGTWSGGTDMLLRVVNYVLEDPNASLPVREGIEWGKELQVGKIEGKIFATAAVDTVGTGKLDLFVAAEKGDHLFRWNGKSFDDITAKSALSSKSEAFVWGDFNGDKRLDLASWDGKELTIFSQNTDGTFTGKVASGGGALKDGCISLTTFDSGDPAQKGRPVILASTKASPVVLTIQSDGSVQGKPLVAGEFPGKDLKDVAECLVADFDDDGIPDILQLASNGGLFYKGTKAGQFAAAVRTNVAAGAGKHGVCIGDWDGDGLLDIFTCSEGDNPYLWHNMGKGQFSNTISLSGSVAYISKAGGTFAQTCDFNNDGRQGLMMLYGQALTPQLFFNRGFRSFGLSRRLEGQMKSVPQAKDGQQAGCLANFTGDGAPSMVLALASGEVWFFPRQIEDRPMGVNVVLSAESANAGPVTIWAFQNKRAFGAAVIRAGEAGFFYGAQEGGDVTVKWRLPGGEVQQTVVKTNPRTGVVRLVIDKTVGKSGENK